jgi:hypothetical protein
VFVVCMGKQSDSVFGHCDLARPRSLLTRGSGHVFIVYIDEGSVSGIGTRIELWTSIQVSDRTGNSGCERKLNEG